MLPSYMDSMVASGPQQGSKGASQQCRPVASQQGIISHSGHRGARGGLGMGLPSQPLMLPTSSAPQAIPARGRGSVATSATSKPTAVLEKPQEAGPSAWIDFGYPRNIEDAYEWGRELGKGGNGVVRVVTRRDSGQEFACKVRACGRAAAPGGQAGCGAAGPVSDPCRGAAGRSSSACARSGVLGALGVRRCCCCCSEPESAACMHVGCARWLCGAPHHSRG
jgi:hypothetical protein